MHHARKVIRGLTLAVRASAGSVAPRGELKRVAEEGNLGPFLVTGATGNVGSAVIHALLAAGARVRAAIHHLDPNGPPGAFEGVRFDFSDPSTYAPALEGVQGIFLMRPNPVLAVRKTLNCFVDAAAAQGVKHCVFLSVAGADSNRFVPHHAVEQHLMRGPMTWTLLRAGFFAQNLTGPYREDIREGSIVLPAGEGRVAYVDAKDLGAVAARALQEPHQHAARAYHLTGPDALSFRELAALLSDSLGRVVRYQPASILQFWRHCRRRGIALTPTIAYTVIHAALRGGAGGATDPALAQLLGHPARSMREFIDEHRSAWA